jgi:inorganic triphosphatase YgiF
MGNGGDDRHEAEIKLLILAEHPTDIIDAVASLGELDGRRLGPVRIRTLRDTYFDTPDLRLRERRFNLRLRNDDERLLATLKGPKTSLESGVVIRREVEAPWSAEVAERILSLLADAAIDLNGRSDIADPGDALRAAGLVPVQIRRTRRHARHVLDGSGRSFAELMLDAVTYLFGECEVRHHEVEIEARDVRDAAGLEPLADDLLKRFGGVLRRWRRGKLATGIAIRDLLEDGSLDGHVNDGTLDAHAYDLIDARIGGTRRGLRPQ